MALSAARARCARGKKVRDRSAELVGDVTPTEEHRAVALALRRRRQEHDHGIDVADVLERVQRELEGLTAEQHGALAGGPRGSSRNARRFPDRRARTQPRPCRCRHRCRPPPRCRETRRDGRRSTRPACRRTRWDWERRAGLPGSPSAALRSPACTPSGSGRRSGARVQACCRSAPSSTRPLLREAQAGSRGRRTPRRPRRRSPRAPDR